MPSALRRWWPAIAGLLAVALVFLLPLSGPKRSGASVRPGPAASASPTPAPGIPAVAVRRPPRPGEARYLLGPFADRLRLERLTLSGGQARGEFAQTADNSSILVMEVQADFYDAAGRLLGSRRTTLRQPDVVRTAHGGTGPKRYGGNVAFSVAAAPAWAAQVSGVLVSVPVLVNE